jgi:hypothetical protein
LTVVSATVSPERESELTEGFRRLAAARRPEGLLRTELLRGQNGTWRIQTLWRDRAVLEALRTSGKPPAALELFRSVGADHTHEFFFVEQSYGS